jgi:hypothetical protein
MTIAKRKKGVAIKRTDKKVRKLNRNKSDFTKHPFSIREIELEDEMLTNALMINNILE